MKEIVNRLHENKQIELAKEILEANGYKVSKKALKESTTGDKIKSWVDQLSKKDSILTLAEVRAGMVGTEPNTEATDSALTRMYDTIAKWLGKPEDKIYFIDSETFYEDELTDEIYEYLLDAEHTRLAHEDIDVSAEDAGDEFREYHAGIALQKLDSTGEKYVSGDEQYYGGSMGFFYLA